MERATGLAFLATLSSVVVAAAVESQDSRAANHAARLETAALRVVVADN